MYQSIAEAGLGSFETKHNPCPARYTMSAWQSTFIKFHFSSDKATHTLVITWPEHNNMNLIVHGRSLYAGPGPQRTNVASQKQEIKDRFLAARRYFSNQQANNLEKSLVIFRENLTSALLHTEAILIAAGWPKEIMKRLPKLSFPDDLSLWINIYRADTHHDDSYRALPTMPDVIETLQDYVKKIEQYTEIIANTAQHFLFNPDKISVNLRLLELSELKSFLVFAKNTQPEPNIPIAPEGYMVVPKNEWDNLNQQNTELANKFEEMISLLKKLLANQRADKKPETKTGFVQASSLTTHQPWDCVANKHNIAWCSHPYNPQLVRLTHQRVISPWNKTNGFAPHCQRLDPGIYCQGEEIEFFEVTLPAKTSSSFYLSILISSAITGFFSALIPELLSDVLYFMSRVSKHTANQVKAGIHLALIVIAVSLTGSRYETLLSIAITQISKSGLKKLGMTEDHAQIAATTLGFFASKSSEFYHENGAAPALAQYIGARCGLWLTEYIAAKKSREAEPILTQ
jgi:hypothetical protein